MFLLVRVIIAKGILDKLLNSLPTKANCLTVSLAASSDPQYNIYGAQKPYSYNAQPEPQAQIPLAAEYGYQIPAANPPYDVNGFDPGMSQQGTVVDRLVIQFFRDEKIKKLWAVAWLSL